MFVVRLYLVDLTDGFEENPVQPVTFHQPYVSSPCEINYYNVSKQTNNQGPADEEMDTENQKTILV